MIVNPWGSPSKFHGDSDILALTTVQTRLMADAKREDFKRAVEANAFLLAEGPWSIRVADDRYVLSLKRLGPRRPMYGPDTEAVDMPPGVGLEVKVPRDQLGTQGRDRLDGNEQTAAVFGVASKIQNGTLTLTPVAVFARYGVSRDGEVPMGAGLGYPDAC